MNNLERDSEQYDVLVMEMSTQGGTQKGANAKFHRQEAKCTFLQFH